MGTGKPLGVKENRHATPTRKEHKSKQEGEQPGKYIPSSRWTFREHYLTARVIATTKVGHQGER